MVCFEHTIQDKIGLHARPVGIVAKTIAPFTDSQITISCGGQTADAKRIFALMALQARQGDTIRVCVEGGDETMVADAIRTVFHDEKL